MHKLHCQKHSQLKLFDFISLLMITGSLLGAENQSQNSRAPSGDLYLGEKKPHKEPDNVIQKGTDTVVFSTFNLLKPKSGQHLISPYSTTAESFIKVMRMKEMIVNLRCFDF